METARSPPLRLGRPIIAGPIMQAGAKTLCLSHEPANCDKYQPDDDCENNQRHRFVIHRPSSVGSIQVLQILLVLPGYCRRKSIETCAPTVRMASTRKLRQERRSGLIADQG
jgi:hypothetical protein